jgi:hypothetical protein
MPEPPLEAVERENSGAPELSRERAKNHRIITKEWVGWLREYFMGLCLQDLMKC